MQEIRVEIGVDARWFYVFTHKKRLVVRQRPHLNLSCSLNDVAAQVSTLVESVPGYQCHLTVTFKVHN